MKLSNSRNAHGRCISYKRSFWLFLCIHALLAMAIAAPALGDNSHIQQTTGYSEKPGVQFSKAAVTIHSKSQEHVSTNTGRRYTVSRETLIVGMDGNEMTYQSMLVPCEVEMTYVSRNGVLMARRIDVKRVAPDAAPDLASEMPR
jgi:hypothetical protein